jgi:hypothetical protein
MNIKENRIWPKIIFKTPTARKTVKTKIRTAFHILINPFSIYITPLLFLSYKL